MKNEIDFVVPKDKKEYNYIGFDFINKNNKFVFPAQYFVVNLENINQKKEARKIILLLKKFRQEYFLNGSNEELFQFNAMLWLVQDYIANGYYIEKEQISKIETNGKINWKKTIKNNSFFLDRGNIIYNEFVRNKTITNDSQIITQIYKACLKYSIIRIGFLFGIEKTENSVFDLEREKDFLVYYLNNLLNDTFLDYKRTLLNHLITIIKNQNSKINNNGFSIYENEFEYVFEFLINKVFGTENPREYYNSYSYYMPDKSSASKLRPDTIIKDEQRKKYYIIDSKYYNFGYSENPKDLPQSSAISKQIGYNQYLKENLSDSEKIYNVQSIFILPFSKEKQDEFMKVAGYAKSDSNNNEDDKIKIVLIDLKTLIEIFLSNNFHDSRKNLLELLSSPGA